METTTSRRKEPSALQINIEGHQVTLHFMAEDNQEVAHLIKTALLNTYYGGKQCEAKL